MALARLAGPDRRRFALGILLMGITVGASVALMGTSAWLIATAALHPSIAALQVAVVGVRFFGLTRGVARYLERLVSHDVTLRLLTRLRVAVFANLAPRVPAIWHRRSSGDLLARLLADVDTIEHAYLRVAGPVATFVLVAGAVTLAVGAISATAGLVVLVGLLGAGTLVPFLAWRLGRRAAAEQIAVRAELHARLVDGVQGAADLLAFDAADAHVAGIDAASRRLADTQHATARASAFGTAFVSTLADLTAVAVIVVLGPLVASGDVSGVALAVATLLTLAAFEAVAPLPAAVQTLPATHAAATRVLEDVDLRALAKNGLAGAPVATPAKGAVLEVESLTFTYPRGVTPALSDITFTLSPGRLVALVGESGSGKSTLVQLLLGFWDVPPGAIRLHGRDLGEWDERDRIAQFAWMSQRADIFTGTLDDNLRLARPDASEEALEVALARAGLTETVSRWPDGRRTWIGEHGATLSGGERQRLALARALLRDAPMVLLDEPASQVDAATEAFLLETCAELARERAVLLVTHRLTGLARADEILVLHRGSISERGTFDGLASREGGIFSRILARQKPWAPSENASLGS